MQAPIAVVPVGGVGILSFITQTRPDHFISETLLRGEEWEPFESLVFRRCITPGSTVCDVGANLGWYSVIAAKLGASVIAIEPDPETFGLLQANLQRNACADVSAHCLALSDHDGQGFLALSATDQGDQRLITDKSRGDRPLIEVPLRRLDDVIGNRTVDVLKVDTQGAELAILRGAERTLGSGVSALLIEFWPKGLRSAGADSEELLACIEELGRDMFEIDSIDQCLLRTSAADISERTRLGRYSADGGDYLDLLLLAPELTGRVEDLIRDRPIGRPLADLLDPAERRRVELTVACKDSASIPKVADAGLVRRFRGTDVQVMHVGVKVVAGGYYGAWMTEIIERLRGHHEPQEERVFHAVIERLLADSTPDTQPVIVELGAFWSYYALWFLSRCPHGRAVLVEPDPSHLEVLHANLALNDADATVIQAAIGGASRDAQFECEDGTSVLVERLSLLQVLERASIDRADVVVCDIQGFETEMLEAACGILARRVRFLMVSTHHVSISGRWDTHDRCLSIIRQSGAHVIAEHSVYESFSGDGLIAASFDPRDRDLHVDLSVARTGTALFPSADAALDEVHRHAANLEQSLSTAVEYAHALEANRQALEAALKKASNPGES